MIHDILPHKLFNEFKICDPKPTDYLIRYAGGKTLLKTNTTTEKNEVATGTKVATYNIPRIGELLELEGKSLGNFEGHYLFSIDDTAFFLDDSSAAKTSGATAHAGYEYMGNRTFRSMDPIERLGLKISTLSVFLKKSLI